MPIQFKCECGQELQVKDEHAGLRVRCPKCQRESTVPVRAELVTAAEPPPPPKASPVKASRDPDLDEPPKRSRKRDDDDEDEDDRPRRKSRSRRDDDDDDERDRPRRFVVQSSGLATASLVLGIVSLCLGALTGVPAAILGLIAFIKIQGSQGRLTGKGKAIAGMATGVLFSILTIFGMIRVQEARERMRDSNNLKQMSLAMINYADMNQGRLPGGVPPGPKGGGPKARPQLSWRVELLPYLEQDNLYRQFNRDEPWDSPTNKRLIPLMPKIYAHPKADPKWAQDGLTVYRVFTGPQCAFSADSAQGGNYPASLPDGTSNTIMIAEAADPVIWTKPDELEYDANKPLPKLGEYFSGRYQVAMFDTSTRTISTSISEKTLRAAITSHGGEALGPDW